MSRLAARLTSPGGGFAAAAASIWALLVIPVEVHYWGITVARDLPAHLLALLSLLAATVGRAGRAGLCLGLAASIRPDAVLWAVSIGPLLRASDRGIGAALRSLVPFLAGALPLFAYNTLTQGHPFAFTQGSEFQRLFASNGLVAHASLLGVSFVSGGAFRLANLPLTLPVHLRYLASGFGAFLPLAVATLAIAAVSRRRLAGALAPYTVVGLLFYSCWGHGDSRYLVGVSLCLIMAAAVGAVELAGFLANADVPWRRRAVALGVVAVVTLAFGMWMPRDPARGLTTLERATAGALALAALVPLLPRWRVLASWASLAPALALAAFGIMRLATAQGGRDPFQHDQIERSRAAIESLVPAGALVLTSPGLGRPAENITHYTHADAHYVGELKLLMTNADYVLLRCTLTSRRLFALLGTADALPFVSPKDWWTAREITRLRGDALLDWFVDPRRAPQGAVLYEVTMSPTLLRR